MALKDRKELYQEFFPEWKIGEVIGTGSNGNSCVFQIERDNLNWKETNALKAVSIIEKRGVLSQFSAEDLSAYNAELEKKKQRKEREAKNMYELRFVPGIIQYYDHHFVNWQEKDCFGCDLLIRMDYGECLRDKEGHLVVSEDQAAQIGVDICNTLVELHGRDNIHCDIKPSNIFFNQKQRYLLGDLGSTKKIERTGYTGTIEYTEAYAAKEQNQRDKQTILLDIYNLGITLYEICNNGRIPFVESLNATREEVEAAIERRRSGERFPPPQNASKAIADVIMKACQCEPRDRWQSAEEMRDALVAAEAKHDVPPYDRYATQPATPGPMTKKQKVSIAAAILLVLLLCAGVFYMGGDGADSVGTNAPSQADGEDRPDEGIAETIDAAIIANRTDFPPVEEDAGTTSTDENVSMQGEADKSPVTETPENTSNDEKTSGEQSSQPDEKPIIKVKSVTLSETELTMKNGSSAILTANVSPRDAANKVVTWSSSDPSIVSVNDGQLTAKGDGSAVITAKADGKSATCEVFVYTEWSDWADRLPDGISSAVETRTLYRYIEYRNDIVATTAASYGEGYVLDHSDVSYGVRSEWSDSAPTPSDSIEIYTQQVVDVEGHDEYRYGCWVGANGGHSYCNVMAEKYYGAPAQKKYTQWSTSQYVNTGTMWTCGSPDTGKHQHDDTGGFIASDTGNHVWYLYSESGSTKTVSGYFWEESRWVDTTYKTQYSYAMKTVTNYFSKMVPAYTSEWSTETVPQSENRVVETKTQYRYMVSE